MNAGRFLSLGIFAVVAGLLIVAGCGDKGPVAPRPQATVNEKPNGGSTADFAMDAKSWISEWKEDQEAATQKYKGKSVELSGTVDRLDMSYADGVGLVFLAVEGAIGGVMCDTVDPEPWSKVSRGSVVTIKGIVPAVGIAGSLERCVITQAGPNPAIAISTQELAKQYADGAVAAASKYKGKAVIVDGEVTGKDTRVLFLKGTDKVKLKCDFQTPADKALDQVQVGQKVKLLGEVRAVYENQEVTLRDCLLITK